MAFVITRLCRDCIHASCLDRCPTDCIVAYRGPQEGGEELPNQLFIDPDGCIDCGLCEAECPWEAIYPEMDVPEVFREDVALNARAAEKPELFEVPELSAKEPPTTDEVRRNKSRWGLEDG